MISMIYEMSLGIVTEIGALERTRTSTSFGHTDLNRARLPIPPPGLRGGLLLDVWGKEKGVPVMVGAPLSSEQPDQHDDHRGQLGRHEASQAKTVLHTFR